MNSDVFVCGTIMKQEMSGMGSTHRKTEVETSYVRVKTHIDDDLLLGFFVEKKNLCLESCHN